MRISVYVPCFNGEATLPEVLTALKNQSRKADQYLLINDRSTDRSVEIALSLGYDVFSTGPTHFGLAAGRNVALSHTAGDILVGIDADAVAEPKYLAEIENLFARRPEIVGVCGCLQEKYTETMADMWRSIHMPQNFGNAEISDPPVLFGSCSAHRTEVLKRLGGWNVRFCTNYEDRDLTLRIYGAGLHTVYSPACKLWHLRRDTVESVLKGFWNWNYPPFELNGSFDSLEKWRTERLAWIWNQYRLRRLQDRVVPRIALVSCLLPWSIVIRDLHQLATRLGSAWEIKPVADLAQRVCNHLGANPSVVNWIANWLRSLIAELPAFPGGLTRLDAKLLHEIEIAALTAIPDASYWSMVQSVFAPSSGR